MPGVWEKFLSSLSVEYAEDLLQQSINQQLFEMLLPSQFAQVLPHASASERNDEIFSKDEVNALRYACGYVPRCLLHRYEKYDGDKYMTFVKCLGEMAVECEGTVHDFLSYTREWIDRVNRGGLFPLNDMTYIFFVSVEKEVRAILPTHMTKETDKEAFQEVVINQIVESDEVQFNWTLVSQCIVSEEDAIELLRDKVSLWVTISSCLPFPLPILLGRKPESPWHYFCTKHTVYVYTCTLHMGTMCQKPLH